MSNNFDGPILIDQLSTSGYLGFGRAAGGTSSTGPRLVPISANPTVGAGLAAPLGTVGILYTAGSVSVWQKTQAADTGWVNVGAISAGPIFPTSIDTAGTAAFQWTTADNQAAAVSFGSAGALNMLVLNTTNGAEQVIVNASAGLLLPDSVELTFGTGTDLVLASDGTDVHVTGNGNLIFEDGIEVILGTGSDFSLVFTGVYGILQGAATADTASPAFSIITGASTSVTGARASGNVAIASGSTDSAGNIAGNTGSVTIGTGTALDNGGQGSGASGNVGILTGNSATGNSGDIVLQTGTAAGTRGVVDVNTPTIDLATQATTLALAAASATALRVIEGAAVYMTISTNTPGIAITQRVTTTDGVTGGTARVIGGRASSTTADSAVVTGNGAAQSFSQTYSIPANTLGAGSTIRIRGCVRRVAINGADTAQIAVRIGGTTYLTSAAVAALANERCYFDLVATARAVPGAAVAVPGAGTLGWTTAGAGMTAGGLSANLATNAPIVVDVQVTMANNPGNTAVLEQFVVDVV